MIDIPKYKKYGTLLFNQIEYYRTKSSRIYKTELNNRFEWKEIKFEVKS